MGLWESTRNELGVARFSTDEGAGMCCQTRDNGVQ